jgi:protein-S-isoprenylcysteine O-methyltransferase Ste14
MPTFGGHFATSNNDRTDRNKSVGTGAVRTGATTMVWLMFLWSAWCALHSLLITTGVRQWFERRGGAWQALYRGGYVVFSLATLLPLLSYTAALPQRLIVLPYPWMHFLQLLLLVYAAVMFIGGWQVYDLKTFIGLRQWQDYRTGRTSEPPILQTGGILRYVRHPWYSGGIALLWALPALTDVTLLTRSLLTVYLLVGTLIEEYKLRQNLGEPYRHYCRRTPMLFPWKRGR